MTENSSDRKVTLRDLDLFASPPGVAPAELVGYLDAAAVLVAFDPFELHPVGGSSDSDINAVLGQLLPLCEPITEGSARGYWRILLPDRRSALRRLGMREAMQRALAANPDRPELPVQVMFERVVAGEQIALGQASREELAGLLTVLEWVDGIIDSLPTRTLINRALAWSDLLEPMRRLAGTDFVGRQRELSQLTDYIFSQEPRHVVGGPLAPGSTPPLFVYGPGGIGKSTLLGRFILDHFETPDTYIAYIDLDRPTIRPDIPATVLLEAFTQLRSQLDEPALLDGPANEISYSIRRTSPDRQSPTLPAGLRSALEPLLRGSIVLMVIDTFEEAQFLGPDVVWSLVTFLLELTTTLPGVRLILAGRTLPDEFLSLAFSDELTRSAPGDQVALDRIPLPYRPIGLAELDLRQARELIRVSAQQDGLPGLGDGYLDELIGVVSCNPMCIRLAARLLAVEGVTSPITKHSEFLTKLRAEKVQALLYGRILSHLHAADLRAIAHPGLILRRITPDVIRDILAAPCGLTLTPERDEYAIFAALRREVTLVEVDPADGSLRHRADVRRAMLEDLTDQTPADVIEQIDRSSVRFYESRSDPVSRGEEIYHRLRLGEPGETLDARWMPEAASRLKSAVMELSAQQSLWLAQHLGITLDDSVRQSASQQAWEDQAARSAERYLQSGAPERALEILEERSERLPRSPLYLLQAQTLRRLGEPDAALQVARTGVDAASKAGAIDMTLQLLLQMVTTTEGMADNESAGRLFTEASAVASHTSDDLLRFRVAVTKLRLHRKLYPGDVGGMATLRRNALQELSSNILQAIRSQPVLLREAAAELGVEDPRLMSAAIEILGVDVATDEQAEALGNAIVNLSNAPPSQGSRNKTLAAGSEQFQDAGLDVGVIRSWAGTAVAGSDVRALAGSVAGAEPGAEVLRDFREYFRAGEPNPLIELFRQCVVHIGDVSGGFLGTGFFVAPGRVLTCAHVVFTTPQPTVLWRDRSVSAVIEQAAPPLGAISDRDSYPLPDLAVLALVGDPQDWNHPCARLTAERPVLAGSSEALYLAGYTSKPNASPALTGMTTEFESVVSGYLGTFFRLKRGQLLPGFSGSPLLNLRIGSVTGIVQSRPETSSELSNLGGFAVPAEAVATAFPEVLKANREFHLRDSRWVAAVEAENARASERASSRARIPLIPPIVPLPAGQVMSLTQILRPRHAVVGYVGREQLLNDLAAWCETESTNADTTEMWFVTGEGGFGKTRLAVEACGEAEARGWTTGLLSAVVSEDRIEDLADWPGRLMVVIDYAETRPGLVAQLTTALAARPQRPPTRILLLVRRRATRGDLLAIFNAQQAEELNALLRRAPLSRLDDADTAVDRLRLFDRALQDFAARLGEAAVPIRRPQLRAAHFAQPLYVLTAALLVLASPETDVDAVGEQALLRLLLAEHEADHWNRWDRRRDLGLDPADQRTAVALATLLGADEQAEAVTVARLIPSLGVEPESRLVAIARWLGQLYPTVGDPNPFAIGPLEPDRLGEVLVGDVLQKYPGLLTAAFHKASERQLCRVLRVTVRIARDNRGVGEQLRAALNECLGDLLQRALQARDDELLVAVTSAMNLARPAEGALAAADRFPRLLPVRLQPLAADVTRVAVEGLRIAVAQDPAKEAELARMLNILASRLGEVGQRDQAVEAAWEAVSIRRQLAQADPGAYLPDLAASLNNLAISLGETGQRDQALDTAREAVSQYRQLAQASPDAYLPSLAASLNNLATSLGETGQRDQALDTAREAVSIRRQLAQANPAGYLPDLAASLNNLASRLSETGQRDQAVEAAREAVSHYRQLAQASPDAYLPSLAASLNNLATSLGETGQRDQALDTAREAVSQYRQLAQASPDAYLPSLAASLNNLATSLGETGQRDQALDTAREAVSQYRQLAQASPAAYLPDLALSLNNLASRLGETGQRDQALDTAREAVSQYRQLAQASPAAYLPSLAASLNNLASRLGETGQRDQALDTAREAVSQYRQLAQASPAAYLPDLALSLNNLATSLGETGQRDQALDTAREAVSIRRQLAQASPDAYLPSLAASLNNLASRLSETGQGDQALDTAREAVSIRRQLAQASPDAYLPSLAASLNNLASRLSETGQGDQAVEAAREAVSHYRQLAQASPDAYLPSLAISLNNLANLLVSAGQANEVEALFSDLVNQFADNPRARGHLLLARGRWQASQRRTNAAVDDLAAAAIVLDEVNDREARGQARQLLRSLREGDQVSFDQAWRQSYGPPPVWLRYPTTDTDLIRDVIAWVNTLDWVASKRYLENHAASLLTERAEAAIEFLIDDNPTIASLQQHLDLLRLARTQGSGPAYTSLERDLLVQEVTQILQEWVDTPTWEESRAYAASHADELLSRVATDILDRVGEAEPGNFMLRLHRGLVGHAATAGFDAAYELRTNEGRLTAALTTADPDFPVSSRLALARLYSGGFADDSEAHFQLACVTLLAGNAGEAAAALTDCAEHAAPYERRDFASRFSQLADVHPDLAPLVLDLLHILETRTHSESGD